MAEIRIDLEEANGNLPMLCMCCGNEATVTKTRNMSWCPPWVGILIVAGLIPYAIVAIILTKKATVQVPLCDQHKGHWFNRNLMVILSLLVFMAIGGVATGISLALDPQGNSTGPFVCLGGVVLFIIWLIILIAAQNTAIRPKEITDYEITLQGVSNEFVDAMEEHDRESRDRRKKRKRRDEDADDEEEEEERPRKKSSSSSDAIRDEKRRRSEEIEEDEPRPRKKRRPVDEGDD